MQYLCRVYLKRVFCGISRLNIVYDRFNWDLKTSEKNTSMRLYRPIERRIKEELLKTLRRMKILAARSEWRKFGIARDSCVLHVHDYRFAYDPALVDTVVACCSMGSRESKIRLRYARSTALVCRARRNSCFPLTLICRSESLESSRETTSRIYKGQVVLPTHPPFV